MEVPLPVVKVELGLDFAPAARSMLTIAWFPSSKATSIGYTGCICSRLEESALTSPRKGLFTSEKPCRSKKDDTAAWRPSIARGESGSRLRRVGRRSEDRSSMLSQNGYTNLGPWQKCETVQQLNPEMNNL